ncbi:MULTISPECIES: DUF4350 domain-containing protein [unclassified Microbacterium]|uniref:DUF4350 domain-containing protein n=1 Tax=unclassified Microbacterium TaxID=2609290 RepID=UPI000CFB2E01|nr:MULTISPECIES: DUF4350 domain-containing protein [unclassified Microbacterium]PQZ56328.1 hypothetical protein CQ032_09555 [Microbacterium sp. MYb43]PQZ79316.1 hypothetical protein CQ031_09190 [Microbacterium sp. MYb40]PRB19883.1 hypothetical protein CQ040_13380 [Microbacterium sp. MYb54]PRB26873.1 hypothetical protein CQ037_11925 [Microbacterium sp. MYb50]PRB65999.1 hypothetical protein CQ021_12295 [Microbacterium sp. MYb24]
MTVIEQESPAPSTAEHRPSRAKTIIGWVIVAALVLIVAFIALRVSVTGPGDRGALDPEGRNDAGALALAEILRDQGVDVDVYRSRAEARAAIDENTTLVMANPYTLTDEALETLMDPAERVVFLSTSTHLLKLLRIGENASGTLPSVSAQCDAAEFADVGTIRADRLFTAADGVNACFGGSEGAAVLMDGRTSPLHAVVEGTRLFSNEYLAENGNAALALALLGQTDRVVWYVPSFDDSDIEAEPTATLGSLTPAWVTPAILLLIVAGIAISISRGQRFGPLVAETLPVTVRASETMHGRARLTAKAADAPHAAQALRDGAQRRLARRLGLAVHAGADEVADAASDRLRIPRGTLQALLAGPLPEDDAALIELARRLDELEKAVEADTRTARGEE